MERSLLTPSPLLLLRQPQKGPREAPQPSEKDQLRTAYCDICELCTRKATVISVNCANVLNGDTGVPRS